eukprot:5408468-Prymnesium_polylepis.1
MWTWTWDMGHGHGTWDMGMDVRGRAGGVPGACQGRLVRARDARTSVSRAKLAACAEFESAARHALGPSVTALSCRAAQWYLFVKRRAIIELTQMNDESVHGADARTHTSNDVPPSLVCHEKAGWPKTDGRLSVWSTTGTGRMNSSMTGTHAQPGFVADEMSSSAGPRGATSGSDELILTDV